MLEVKVFPELTFNEEAHIYRLNGHIIPSVTTIMKPLSEALYGGIDENVLNKAANRGTAVHNSIENFVKFGIEDVDPAFRGYFNGFLKWWSDCKPEPMGTECRVYHRILMYAGTADMPCILNQQSICVDFKTSAAINKMLTGIQLEAYAKAYESHGIRFDGKAIVHLKNDGTYQMEIYKPNDSESWTVFGALLTVKNYIQKFS